MTELSGLKGSPKGVIKICKAPSVSFREES